jgi:flagellar basal body-associated protein FliL
MEEKNDFLQVDESQPKKDKQKKVIVVLGIAIIFFTVILTIVLVSAIFGTGEKNDDTTRYELTSENKTESTTTADYFNDLIGIDGGTQSESVTLSESKNEDINNTSVNTTKNQLIESYEQLSVNGENKLSDHYENEFIQLVSDKYGVDTDLLVAVYSVPDTGTNFVLQFNGDKNLKGEYIKSPDTLEVVYQIDLEKNIKVATGKPTGNEGVSYAESVMCVAMVKTIVMEQYPNYFTGLE